MLRGVGEGLRAEYVRAENRGHVRFYRLDPRVGVGREIYHVLGPCLSSGLLV
jgi:hypothetical protein